MRIKRSQAERNVATRTALVSAARPLFLQQGYAAVTTDQLARAAGVTRGALYHQFAGKEELFVAVFEQIEQEITDRIAAALTGDDLVAQIGRGIAAWLDACADPDVNRLVLVDAPAVLGWERWRAIGRSHGLGLLEATLTALVARGDVPEQPVTPLAHVLTGAVEEAALFTARADDPAVAREQATRALVPVFTGLLRTGHDARGGGE